MMHQIITDHKQAATVINSVGAEGNIYQIIPFRRYNTDLFLILWFSNQGEEYMLVKDWLGIVSSSQRCSGYISDNKKNIKRMKKQDEATHKLFESFKQLGL